MSTPVQITQLRAAQQRAMTMRCQLNRRAVTGTNEYGESTMGAWGVLAASLPCLLYQETGPGETLTPGRDTVARAWVLQVGRTVDVTTTDTVSNVVDATGLTIASGPLNILDVVPELSHLSLTLSGLTP